MNLFTAQYAHEIKVIYLCAIDREDITIICSNATQKNCCATTLRTDIACVLEEKKSM